jgi:hypothetical protein
MAKIFSLQEAAGGDTTFERIRVLIIIKSVFYVYGHGQKHTTVGTVMGLIFFSVSFAVALRSYIRIVQQYIQLCIPGY